MSFNNLSSSLFRIIMVYTLWLTISNLQLKSFHPYNTIHWTPTNLYTHNKIFSTSTHGATLISYVSSSVGFTMRSLVLHWFLKCWSLVLHLCFSDKKNDLVDIVWRFREQVRKSQYTITKWNDVILMLETPEQYCCRQV